MAQNPLLGSKISLISKKNIRYEGTLYSINETNATVALANVKSYGTEGREKTDPENTAFVAPQDGIHAYLLFRGCDIKDLHVHEEQPAEAAAAAAAAPKKEEPATAKAPPKAPPASDLPPPPGAAAVAPKVKSPATKPPQEQKTQQQQAKQQQQQQQSKQQQASKSKKSNNQRGRGGGAQVGTGASLLNRKARGSVQGGPGPEATDGEFDIQGKLEEFEKDPDAAEDDEAGDEVAGDGNTYYEKDDFFDSISCDALDKQHGVDNRLKGSQERTLNTETFGAVALNNNRRRRGGRGYGRGRGGRGRGRGRGGRGRGSNRNNNNNNNSNKGPVQPAPVVS